MTDQTDDSDNSSFREMEEMINLTDQISNLYPENLRFLILYLAKKRSHKEKFTQQILNLNRINVKISKIEDEIFFNALKDDYFKVLGKTYNYYHLQLTQRGLEVARILHYDRNIILFNFPIKAIAFFIKSTKKIKSFLVGLSRVLRKFFKYSFIEHPMQTLTVIGLIIGIIVGIIEIIKYLK